MVKQKIKKSKMTLDRLALITQQGFLDVDKKFDAVDKKFDVIDKKFDAVDKKFDVIDKRFDAVDKRFDKIESGINEMKENSSELFNKLDKFIALYEKQEQEMSIFGAQLRRIEERVIKLEKINFK